MRKIDFSIWLRAGALVFALLALAATVAPASREESRERISPATSGVPARAGEPLAAELARCKTITPESPRDDACEQAWAKNRRRFFGALAQPTISADVVAPAAPVGARP